jgi:hypothetical protein
MGKQFGFGSGERSMQFSLVLVLGDERWFSLVMVPNSILTGYGLVLV